MADPQVKNLAYQALGASLAQTAANPATSLRQVEMKPTPRSPRMGMFADAMMAVRDFANRLQIPQGVPLIGGEGVGSLLMGRAPEELVEMSYGNMPVRVNPYAGRTAGFMPEMKPGRGAQVADLLSLAGVPGGGRTAAAAMGAADLGSGAERALIGYHGTPYRFAPTPANPLGEFRASQIGTGEGAQAYGYGTYFAESPGVAKGYREKLSTNVTVDGAKLQTIPSDSPMAAAHNMTVRNIQSGMSAKEAIAATNKYWTDAANEMLEFSKSNPELIGSIRKESASRMEIANAAKTLKPESFYRDPGSLYTVDIPDEMIGKMLDWDRPLSQQPQQLQQKLYNAMMDAGFEKQLVNYWLNNKTGSELHRELSGRLAVRQPSPFNAEVQTAEFLKKAGVPGIRYLDEGSRGPSGTGRWLLKFKDGTEKTYDYKPNDDVLEMMGATASPTGTRNIVVFPGEESKVKILSRD